MFELLLGGARVVTGRIAADNPTQFFFHTPHTDLAVEGPADFSVVLVNPAYIVVSAGSVISSNGMGTTTLGTGSTTVVPSSSDAPAPIKPAAVPAARRLHEDPAGGVGGRPGGGPLQAPQRRARRRPPRPRPPRDGSSRRRSRAGHRRRRCSAGRRQRWRQRVDHDPPLSLAVEQQFERPRSGPFLFLLLAFAARACSRRSRALPGRPASSACRTRASRRRAPGARA